ncbi:hypothetical protein I5U59_04180 [Stenotrophomonas maltophilia]|nr:hypothetical protein [Stenotrophomonas maltophilia]MBH1477101.1 hypothetical protein [Stenotrophomonas maltophilia]MBH1502270.1 hypothetical protein [Stenotrophomonas maltophilia]MBH1784454.1 hypothetical protein [Stenotrophomonas maltophilia]
MSFEQAIRRETVCMSLEFMAYGGLIGFIVGAAAVLIFQDMLQAVMS